MMQGKGDESMAFLPPIVWKKDGDEIQQLWNYVMQLEEQIRYVTGNLGSENLTDGAIGENALAPSVRTEILESKNSAQKNSLAIKKTAKELMVKVEQEIADRQSGETTLSNQISATAEGLDAEITARQNLGTTLSNQISVTAAGLSAEIAETEAGAYKKQTSFEINADGVEVKSTGSFNVEAGAGFNVHSRNLDCDETGLFVKSGTLQGEHLTTDGTKMLSASDIVIATTAPSGYNDRIWVKPLDSVAVTYSRSISARAQLIGWSGTITTNGANSAASGTHTYVLKIPYHVDTSSGSGADITVTIGGTLTFTAHVNPGYYPGGTYQGDGVIEKTLNSNTWIGGNNSLSISISGSAPGHGSDYKLNVGQIVLQAISAGNSGSGWKACEIKVYQG